jgi:hypothetical protein
MQIEWSERAEVSCGQAVRRSAKDNPLVGKFAEVAKRLLTERAEKLVEGISSAAKRRGTERAKTREEFELERVVSCGLGDRRWRTKLHLGGREPFDDLHWAITLGAAPKIGGIIGGRGILLGWWILSCPEQVKTKRQACGTSAVGQEAEVSDAHKTLRK